MANWPCAPPEPVAGRSVAVYMKVLLPGMLVFLFGMRGMLVATFLTSTDCMASPRPGVYGLWSMVQLRCAPNRRRC
jgi:hypothetical protein